MKLDLLAREALLFSLLFIATCIDISAQSVGINTADPEPGALLDITSTDQGLLIPRVALTGTNDTTTITPAATTGVLVYNTVTAGALAIQVTPGFYYWSGVQWRRLYNQGYTLRYPQTAEVTSTGTFSNYFDLTGMDTGNINIPFSGTYQILVKGYYAAGSRTSGAGTDDGAGQGSISLWMDTNNSGTFTRLRETSIVSSSKRIDVNSNTDFHELGQAATIMYTIDLDVINSYSFKVQGREWHRVNVDRGKFGKDTSGYIGSGGSNIGQRGEMTITLVKQQ